MSFKPRRVFASSFVMISAASAQPHPKPTQVHFNPPPQEVSTERHWRLTQKDHACFAQALDCAPKSTCAPVPYTCDDNLTPPLTIVRPADSTECFVDRSHTPSYANPPPPEKVRCPK